MDDVEVLAVVTLEVVRVVKRVEHLDDDVNYQVGRERPVHLLVEPVPLAEVVAVDVLDDHQVVALFLAEVDDADQARVPQAGHQARLSDEHPRHRPVDHQVRRHPLHDHRLGEAGGAFAPSQVDDTHAALREGANDPVSAEDRPADHGVMHFPQRPPARRR